MEISIEKDIEHFNGHLQKNDHVIFSAPFGDGKSYFLNKFQRDCSDKYVFVTLYPVNYQVVDTYDVFELIKRDILVQIIANRVYVSEDIDIPESIYAYYYMLHFGKKIEIEDMVPLMEVLNLDESIKANFLSAGAIWNVFRKLKDGYDDYKSRIDQTKTECKIDNYLKVFSKGKGKIYECDMMSFLISSFIEQYKQNNNEKQVVLCIEDLDRLDPAHVFRILNILSAHVDRQFISFDEQEKFGFRRNKFGFDKMIVVCDYPKLESLFYHFYGTDANFDGYISKFTSSSPFFYSFRKRVSDELFGTIDELIRFDVDALRKILSISAKMSAKINNLNVRTLEYLISDLGKDIKRMCITFPDQTSDSVENLKLIQVFVIFNRLGIIGSDKEDCLIELFQKSGLHMLIDIGRFILFGLPDFTDSITATQHINGEDRALIIEKNSEGELTISIGNIYLPSNRVNYKNIIEQVTKYLI